MTEQLKVDVVAGTSGFDGPMKNVVKTISDLGRTVDKLANQLTDVAGALQDVGNKSATSFNNVAKGARTAQTSIETTLTSAQKLKNALSDTSFGSIAQLKPIDLKGASIADINALSARLREAGTSLSAFLNRTKDFSEAEVAARSFTAEINRIRQAAGIPISFKATFDTSGVGVDFARGIKARADKASAVDAGALSATKFSAYRAELDALIKKSDEARAALAQLGTPTTDEARTKYAALTQQIIQLGVQANVTATKFRESEAQINKLAQAQNSTLGKFGYGKITAFDINTTKDQQQVAALNAKIQELFNTRLKAGAVRDVLNNMLGSKFQIDMQHASGALVDLVNQVPRFRSAMYGVGTTMALMGTATVAAFAQLPRLAMQWERDMASVERTAIKAAYGTSEFNTQAQKLKDSFIGLAQSIPVSFGQLTEIGTLAGQLNIPTDSIASFTKTVAQFSATTDVNATQAATAFGRLDQLIKGVNGDYKALGSAILAVGMNSVATESQIINIASQISAMANVVGFTASEVIGLSSAIASVGGQPELARGTTTRLFSEIGSAITEAGSQLNNFAKISQMSASEFAASWKSDSASTFLQFLNGLGAAGSNAEQALRSVGITSVRDIPLLLKLAQSHTEVARQFALAQEAYIQGTMLQDRYNVILNTTSTKLDILKNNFEALVATAGNMQGAFSGVIDVGIQTLKILQGLINNPIAASAIGIASAVALIGGAMAILAGVTTRLLGGLSGLITGAVSTKVAMGTLDAALEGVVVTTNKAGVSTISFADSLMLNKAALTENAVAATLTAEGNFVVGESATVAGAGMLTMAERAKISAAALWQTVTATKAFQAASSMVGWTLAITAALAVVGTAYQAFAESQKSAADKTQAYFGDLTSVLQAVKQDTQDYQSATEEMKKTYETFTVSVYGSNEALATASQTIIEASGAEEQLKKTYGLTSSEIGKQTYALGANTKAAIDNLKMKKLTDPEGPFVKFFQDPKLVEAAKKGGFDIANAIAVGMEDPATGLKNAKKMLEDFYAGGAAQIPYDSEAVANALQGLIDLYNAQIGINGALQASVAVNGAAGKSLADLTVGIDEAANTYNSAADTMYQANDNFIGSLGKLSSAIQQNGDDWSTTTSTGIANINALNEAITSAINTAKTMGIDAAGTIGQVFAQLQADGVQTAAMLENLKAQGGSQAIAAYGIQAAQAGTYAGLTGAFNAMKKSSSGAGSAVDSVTKKVYTLGDYANDLSNIWKRAFEIRFSGQQGLDAIAKSFNSIRQSISDTRDEIDGLNADTQKLNADRALQEYFLSVAVAYGDSIKAQEIRANIAKIDSDLVAKNKQLQKAQDKSNKTLVGSSDAAIANRAEITGLVSDYQSYIQALAATGADQATLQDKASQLKAEFIAQATQLGYNATELDQYSAAFDDVSTAINNVPRNITVSANTDPALQALNELNARAASATAPRTMSVGMSVDYSAMAKFARGANILSAITEAQGQLADFIKKYGSGWGYVTNKRNQIAAWTAQLDSGNFATGGYTGAGGKYEPAGIVHKGEYVIPKEQVNQSTGMPYFIGQSPKFYSGGGSSQGSSSSMVSLSPEDRALLREAGGSGNIVLYADGKELARSVNDGNRQIVAQGGRV